MKKLQLQETKITSVSPSSRLTFVVSSQVQWSQAEPQNLVFFKTVSTALNKELTPHYNFDIEIGEMIIWDEPGADESLKTLK